MKICIVGQGVAGWMTATALSRRGIPNLEKITIIGSEEIKSIGVGESNTMALLHFFQNYNIPLDSFIRDSDASVKLGVYYKDWGDHDFLHNFKQGSAIADDFLFKSLSNKPPEVSVTDIIAPELWKKIHHNLIPLTDEWYGRSWHFDAAKFISFLEKLNKSNSLIESIKDNVDDCVFSANGELKSLILKSGNKINADYFVFANGSSSPTLNAKLGKKYVDLSDILLTNKAWVYPLKFTDKRKQFHPYTMAKAMNCGWRWITPTYSRIGTGYVFSSRHISDDEALNEFLMDIGDTSISPKLVDFKPRYDEQTFKQNYCTVGMSNGFLEPLDAPGLSITVVAIEYLIELLQMKINQNLTFDEVEFYNFAFNIPMSDLYKKWCSFILNQYKTSNSKHTKFWIDHRNVQYDYYDDMWKSIKCGVEIWEDFKTMFCHTSASRNYRWETNITQKPISQKIPKQEWLHHLDYIDSIRGKTNTKEDTYSKDYFVSFKENIWELNNNLQIEEEIFEDSKIYYVDNFYKNPDKVLSEIKSKNSPLWKIAEPNTLNSTMFEDRRLEMKYKQLSSVYDFISSIVHQSPQYNKPNRLITNNLLLYNHPYNNFEDSYWWPHQDVGYTGILYLNKDCGGKTGTNLYQNLGEDLNNDEFEHSSPWRSKKLYGVIKYLESKFNRLVLFDGRKYLHGAHIEDDRHMKEPRMNQVFFFEQVDS